MAVFYPTLETIAKFKVSPTEGEWALLNFLERTLDDSYEVYFNPYLNGDRPDVVVMRRGNGVMVIEVKDWDLDNYRLSSTKQWELRDGTVVKSPVDQVIRYKKNLYELHVDDLMKMAIYDFRRLRVISCAIYFHNATSTQVNDLLISPYRDDEAYMKFMKSNIDLLGRDSLTSLYFSEVLCDRYMSPKRISRYFTDRLYQNFKRLLAPALHLKSQGVPMVYSSKQKDVIYSTRYEQRIKGVFGSGKTTVLAARAVQAYKRALNRTNHPRVLILTYNITLRNLIHDKLWDVEEEFKPECFVIINYHTFIKAELNDLGIPVNPPEVVSRNDEAIHKCFEDNYFSNVQLFESRKDSIRPYDAVLIDEVQDYRREWLDIIKNYFRDPHGDYVLFGDVKQNIYGVPIEGKDVSTNVYGRPIELNSCFRSQNIIVSLIKSFQTMAFSSKYDIDDFRDRSDNDLFAQLRLSSGQVDYTFCSETEMPDAIAGLYGIIRGHMLDFTSDISPNDLTVLGYSASHLRLFDCYYRYASHEKTNSMLEVLEFVYAVIINMLHVNGPMMCNCIPHCGVLGAVYMLVRQPGQTDSEIRKRTSKLLTLYHLYSKWPDTFSGQLSEHCELCGFRLDRFLYIQKERGGLLGLVRSIDTDKFAGLNIEPFRRHKKLHFWFNSGTIKISTVHSFKGLESEVVYLVIDNSIGEVNYYELLYTGLTRARSTLQIINFGNLECDQEIRPLVESIRATQVSQA